MSFFTNENVNKKVRAEPVRCFHGNDELSCRLCQLPAQVVHHIASYLSVRTVYSVEDLELQVKSAALPFLRLQIFCSNSDQPWDIAETLESASVWEVQVEFYKSVNYTLLSALLGMRKLRHFSIICKELTLQATERVCKQIGAAGRPVDLLHLTHTRGIVTDSCGGKNIPLVSPANVGFLRDLPVHHLVQTLLLNGNEFGEQTGRILGNSLQGECSRLETLYIGLNRLGDEGTLPIAQALGTNRRLKTLNLRDNEIGDAGAIALAAALKQNLCLNELFLCLNDIHDNGAIALGEALKVNTNLKVLDLVRNNLGPSGSRAIAAALKENTSLSILRLKGNLRLGNEGAFGFAESLKLNKGLRELYLDACSIDNIGAKALGGALRENESLRVLDLQDNDIGPAGADSLLAGLRVKMSLQFLDLSRNLVAPKGLETLEETVETNRKLNCKEGHYQQASFRDPANASFLRYVNA